MNRRAISRLVAASALLVASTDAVAQVKPQWQPVYNALQTLSQYYQQKAEEADSAQKIESGESTPEAEQEKADNLRQLNALQLQLQQQQTQVANQRAAQQAAAAAAPDEATLAARNDAFGCTAMRQAYEADLTRLAGAFDAFVWDHAKTEKQNYEMQPMCTPRTLPPLPPVPAPGPGCPAGMQCAVQ